MTIRLHILKLPFTTVRKDETINLWSVADTGDDDFDTSVGRTYAALLIHLMRDFDAPFLLGHVADAWRDSRETSRVCIAGAIAEISDAVMRCDPRCSTLLALVPHLRFCRDDARTARLALPTTRVDPETGEIDYWAVRSSGDYQGDVAKGKFYGAALCKLVHETKCAEIFDLTVRAFQASEMYADREGGVRTGLNLAIGELLCESAATTPYQQALYHAHRTVQGNPGGVVA